MTLQSAKDGAPAKPAIKNLSDPKFKGQTKMKIGTTSNEGKQSVVHFVENPKTKERTDFKFKKSTETPKKVKE